MPDPQLLSRIWWIQAPIALPAYLYVSKEEWPERVMLAYLAFVSIAAMGATYAGKKEANDAKKAAQGKED
jgi:hypothetical protein